MCVTPSHIFVAKGNSYEKLPVPCGTCWACRKNKINDVVGRCLCEAQTSDWVYFMTLTYDDKKLEHPSQTNIIHKEDFQNFMKRCRRKFQIRYLVAGEYGSKKGRVHFHAMLFGKGKRPSWDTTNKRAHIAEWPWGHVTNEETNSEKSIRYVAKYLNKGKRKIKNKEEKVKPEWVSYSRIPILGEEHIRERALEHVRHRLFPHNFSYRPPAAAYNRTYTFYGKARELLLDTIFEWWPEAINIEKSDFMEKAVDRYFKQKHKAAWEALTTEQQASYLEFDIRPQMFIPVLKPHMAAGYYWRLIEHYGIEKEKEKLREIDPQAYALIRASYPRDIDARPPYRPNKPADLGSRHSENTDR